MTNPEYVNPGIVQTDEDKQKAYEAQQEVAARSPLTAVPDVIKNAEAEKAAEEAKDKVEKDAESKARAASSKPASSRQGAAPKV